MSKNQKLNIDDFYQKLPDEILKNASRLKIDANVKKNVISDLVPDDKSSSLQKDGTKFKALYLDERLRKAKISKEVRKTKFNQRKKKENKLTARQRHNLFKIDKSTNLKYEVFLELNKLWRKYVCNLAKISGGANRNQTANYLNSLVKADYHGAYLIVANSKNPLLIGLKGFVIKENKKVFYLINEQNRILGTLSAR